MKAPAWTTIGPWLITIAVALAVGAGAAGAAALVIPRLLPARPVAAPPVELVADWQRFATGGQRTGAQDAPVVIVAFSDFQCTYCRSLAGSLSQVQDAYNGKLAVVFRHFPVAPIHPHARAAAAAAICAAPAGRFTAMHDLLFAVQDSLGTLPWAALARRAGVSDVAAFESCLGDAATSTRIDTDVRLGHELGVQGTPTLLVNGRLVRGAPPQRTLDSLVAGALTRAAVR